MTRSHLVLAGFAATIAVAVTGCGGGGSTSGSANAIPAASLSRAVQADAVTESSAATSALIIHVGFKHTALAKSKYGPVAFYAPGGSATGPTKLIYVKAGSKVAFLNDDTTRHTASGLGSTSFPTSFDNTSGLNEVGNTINSGLTWNTVINPNVKSRVFTVGPKGVYFFGCYFHYHITPSMRDVIISQ